MPGNQPLKVNLGSGSRGLPGWINIDAGLKYKLWPLLPLIAKGVRFGIVNIQTLSWMRDTSKPPPNLKVRDLHRKLPFKDGSVDFVYSAETIEHFEYYAALSLLREIHRVLVPGGLVRLTTPDGLKISYAYTTGKIDNRRFNAFFYEPLETYFEPALFERLGRKIYSTKYHQWIYDVDSLSSILRSIGFRSVTERSVAAGDLPDLVKLESFRPEEVAKDRAYSIYIEARK